MDEILLYILGNACTQIIYNNLERNSFPKYGIRNRLERFSEELRKLLGDWRNHILGSAPILEDAIAERLCAKLSTKLQERLPFTFSIAILKLKEDYYLSEQETAIFLTNSQLSQKNQKCNSKLKCVKKPFYRVNLEIMFSCKGKSCAKDIRASDFRRSSAPLRVSTPRFRSRGKPRGHPFSALFPA